MNCDAIVVGAGPNGLAAAVTMARAGLSVQVYEAAPAPGGGARTTEFFGHGYLSDVCSAVHPMALASPFFRRFGLADRVDFAVPEVSYAHPLAGGRAGIGFRDLERTVEGLEQDGSAYRRLMEPLIDRIEGVIDLTTHQLLRPPSDLLGAVRYGFRAGEQGSPWWNRRFAGEAAPAMVSGLAGHVVGRQPSPTAAGAGLMLGALAHTVGWPIPIGGSQAIIAALVADLQAHGGQLHTGRPVRTLADVEPARAVLLDIAAPHLPAMAPGRLPSGYLRALRRFRFGNGVAKVDFLLSGPVPWSHPEVARAGTVHLGGARPELAAAAAEVAAGRHPERPFVLLSQPSMFDASRVPAGSRRQVLWAYTHVPAGSTMDRTAAVAAQIERAAPGFADLVLDSHAIPAAEYEQYNQNYVGGDFSAGRMTMRQLLARPVLSPAPWRTPMAGVYLCSASTPPGPAVHGMCGYLAARTALSDLFGLPVPDLSPGAGE